MTESTGGELVVQALRELGVDRVFTIASVHNLPILEAIAAGGDVQVVDVRHEQAAVHAADGFARATGRLGVAITSTGPGAANAMGGLFEATFASSPVLMITGQIETRFLGQGRGYLHEAEHQQSMLRSVTKEVYSVRRVCDVGDVVLTAGHEAMDRRPGPTAVEIPVDLQYGTADVAYLGARPVRPTSPSPVRIDEAVRMLSAARRPLIWAGGGVVSGNAGPALRRLAERLRIPVLTSTQGRGSLPEDHDLCLGVLATSPPLRERVEDADVLLAIGTRFQMFPTDSWTLRLPESLVHVDVDPSVLGRNYRPAVAVVSDAALALDAIDSELRSMNVEPGWVERCTAAAATARVIEMDGLGSDHRSLVEIVRRHVPRGGAIVRDSTLPAYYWGDRLLPILEARTSMNPTGAAIGPGLPLALGATLGRGERSVVLHGDGGIMLSIQELATLAQYDVPLTVCVFNDGGYGVLRDIQAATFDGSRHDVDLMTPDFVQLASAMHVPGERVADVVAFDRAFAASLERSGPYLIEVDVTALEPLGGSVGAQELLS
jgi:acetolactate synthase-1/2/3 large subunit